MTPQSDIYSYGATLYHLITGYPPFSANNAMELLRKHLNERPQDMNKLRVNVSEDWNKLIVNDCMAKKPEDRPVSMADVLRRLEFLKSQTF